MGVYESRFVPVKLDTRFHFSCKACGKCCYHREDLMLSPHDAFRIAKYQNIQVDEMVREFCDVVIDSDTKMPLVFIKTVDEDKKCVFLKENKCSVYAGRPNVCRSFPLGRTYAYNHADDSVSIGYTIQPTTCAEKGVIHSVSEWITSHGIPLHDEAATIWQIGVLTKIQLLVAQINEVLQESGSDELREFYNCLLFALYLNYDMCQEFLPQFKENVKAIQGFVADIQGDIVKG